VLFIEKVTIRPRVLIVDDDPTSLIVLSDALSAFADITTSLAGEDAIKKAINYRPDVILLDIELPGIDGFAVCNTLKCLPETRSAAIIFITSHPKELFESKAFEIGGADFIQKPLDLNICKLRVKNQLKLKHQQKQLINAENDIQSLVSQIPIHITYWTSDFINLYSNNYKSEFFTISPHESVGRYIEDTFPTELYLEVIRVVNERVDESDFEVKIFDENEEAKFFKIHIKTAKSSHIVQSFLLLLTDITDLKDAEKTIIKDTEKLGKVLSSLCNAVFETDNKGILKLMNETAEKMTGYKSERAIGMHINEVLSTNDAQLSNSSPSLGFCKPHIKEDRTKVLSYNL